MPGESQIVTLPILVTILGFFVHYPLEIGYFNPKKLLSRDDFPLDIAPIKIWCLYSAEDFWIGLVKFIYPSLSTNLLKDSSLNF